MQCGQYDTRFPLSKAVFSTEDNRKEEGINSSNLQCINGILNLSI